MSRSRNQHSDAVALWDEIKGLTQLLSSNEKRITKRRETAEKLVNILSKEKNRNKLNDMAITNAMKKGYSPAKAKRWALSVVWSPIINTAFNSASNIANGKGKNKIYADDVKLPLRLLYYSDTSVEGHQVRLEPTCKLSERNVKTILKFCIDMYFNDQARKAAELELLKTLTFLCERVDYVAFFSAETEILSVMRIVEDAMALEEEGESSTNNSTSEAAVSASKIFGAVLESAFELGIGLHLFVSESLELVSRWCEKQLEDYQRSPREASHLFRGVTALLRFHPEQAIKPLTRYGGPILRYAKRSYSHSAPVNRHAIDGYLIAHIIVSQQAGILKGLMPGELGLLGEATLTEHQIKSMLAMVLSALTATQLSTTAKNRVSWNSLDTSVRRHLELCARLLACAQRQFLVHEEWELLEDPNDFLTKMVREISQDEDDVKRLPSDTAYPSVSPPILAKSPWATHVLAPLIHNFVEDGANGAAGGSAEPRSQSSTSQEASPQPHMSPSRHPLVDCIIASEGERSVQASKNSRLLLLVIAACAEAFPSGRCWASTSHKHWSTLGADEIEVDDIAHINMCSPSDFALLVDVVANVLKVAGNGDAELQMLALLCLIRLAEAHRVIISLVHHRDTTGEVATSWRKVWSIIFATEMRYSACSAHATEGSCGELVLILITEMIRGWCTDPMATGSKLASMTRSTFLYRNQGQIWSLPAFGKGNSLRTKQSFELACVFLHRLCLSDESKDNIPDSLPSSIDDVILDNNVQGLYGRRFRLVCLCLHVLDMVNPVSPDSKQKEMIVVVTACLSALVNGEGSWTDTTFVSESQNLTWTRSSTAEEDLQNRFCFTELPVATTCLGATRVSPDLHTTLFLKLWATPMLDPGMSSLQKARLQESIRADCVLLEKSKLDEHVWALEEPSPHIDYVSTKMSSVFQNLLRSQTTSLLKRWSSSYGKNEDDADMDVDSQQSDDLALVPIPTHCLWLRVSLSLCVVPLGEGEKASVDLEWLENDFVIILERIKSGLSNGLCEKRDEFCHVFECMLQIVNFLSELSSAVSSFVMPPTLGKKIVAFNSDCDSLIRSFSGEERSEKKSSWDDDGGESEDASSESDSGEIKKASVTDLLDDSDDDDVVNTRTQTKPQARVNKKSNKRKARPSNAKKRSPRKKRKRHPCPPDSFCASLVGAILVTLNPSVEECEHVVGCLLPTGNDGEVDLDPAYHCLNLLADATVLLHDNAKRQIVESVDANDESFTHRSPISVFCDVFDSFRASAPPASSLHLFGFRLCADCVRLGESEARGATLNSDESNDLVERLTAESESLERRPYLRSEQLRAATFAFSFGKEAFHKCMDSVFPKEFVIPSLRDLSSNVRTHSRGAVAAALRILSDTNKVVQAVQNLLPPVALPSETGEKNKIYQEWYQHFELGSGDTDFENRVWQDAKLSMEVGTIDSLAVVAGVSADSIARDIVYNFIKFSSKRPELEAACFRACGKIASMTGYSSAEAFLSDQGEFLLGRWLESGETIAEIPLLLSSPKLLNLLLLTGQQTRTYLRRKKAGGDSDNDHTKPFDVVNLRDVATDQFVARHRTYLLPQMLLRICRSEPNQNGSTSAKSRIINDRLIQEFCVCLRGNHDDATIKTLVQGRLHDIEALCAPMAHSDLSDLGKDTLELVFNYLHESDGTTAPKVSSNKPHLTIRRMLELSGMETNQVFPAPVVNEAFSEAISAFVSNKKPTKDGDILSAAGTSLTECFLYARHWLSKATLSLQKEKRWDTLSLLFDLMLAQIRQKRFKQTQLSVGVNVAVDIVLDPKLRCIHCNALAILKQVLEEVISIANTAEADELKIEFSSVCRRMVASLMKKHEESQLELLQICKTRAKAKLCLLQKSLGLLGGVSQEGEDGDVWGWDADTNKRQAEFPDFLQKELKDFSYEKNRVLVDSVTGTYDLLLQIFDNAEILELGLECFVGCMPPFSVLRGDQSFLSEMNPRFVAQTKALEFLRRQETKRDAEDLSQSIRFALDELKNRTSWMDEFADRSESSEVPGERENDTRATGTSMTIAQWMLNAELVQLKQKLHRHRLSRGINLCGVETYQLIKELSFVCGASCPHELQTAASKCLGELDARLIDNVLLDEPQKESDWVTEALEADSVLRGAQANAIGVLAGYLHSEHSGVAIAALDTIIALLTTKDGIECWALVNTKAKQDLAPVLSKKKRPANMSRMQLSKLQVDSIRLKTSHPLEMPGDVADNEWCWSEKLWRCRSDSKNSFESWICDLVPALIECCYRVDTKRPSSSFFSCCMALAAIAPKFAEAIFPAIVIDLLDENHSDDVSPLSSSRSGNVFEDTWIGRADSSANRRLSHCFQILLDQGNALPVALALDTIELLRRATQSRFQRSENHKKNSNALPPSASSKKPSKSGRSARSSKDGSVTKEPRGKGEYNKGLGIMTPWKGVPYGTVLKLSGPMVVQACISSKRYASALFYSELYFESFFGRSGAIMEKLASDFAQGSSRALFSRVDISGYYMDGKPREASEIRESAIASLKLLEDCYLQLHEEDSHQAVVRQTTDLQYSTGDTLMIDNGELGHVFAPTLDDLRRLDSRSNLLQNPVALSLQTADTMEALGLRNFVQRYIGSLERSITDAIPSDERQRLREKWFESRLYGMEWNGALLDCCDTNVTDGILSSGRVGANNSILGGMPHGRDDSGFHEAIMNALSDFARDDLQSSDGLLKVARTCLLQPVSTMATAESSMHGLGNLIERLQYLSDIESLVNGLDSPDTLLKRWGFSLLSENDDKLSLYSQLHLKPSFDSAEFTPHMREAMLRFLRFNKSTHRAAPEQFDPQQCLIEHLGTFSRWCRTTKHLDVAEASLQRLRGVLQVESTFSGEDASLQMVLGQRLEEASLCESRGDFATAIRLSKQAISLLKGEKKKLQPSGLSGIDCLLVDSLINCGNWLSKNKIEPARTIMETYHLPGATIAQALYRANRSQENGQRHIRAQIALARLASGLYDSISARVRSLEWIKAGRALAEREQELRHCETMMKEFAARDRRGGQGSAAKSRSAEEQTELAHYSRQLKTEIYLARKERVKTEEHLQTQLRVAVSSFANALSISGVKQESDMSRHVFRMVYLWLKHCSEGNEHKEVNSIIQMAIAKIPSFRFVPLTSQLFAQIDEKEHGPFQVTLHTLVEKMCKEHPYHCVVQLVSVCNGKEVGGGVSGRNANFFLENMSNSKVEAAASIAQRLKRGTSFVGELLENYEILMGAYIQLANAPTAKLVEQGKIKNISMSQACKSNRLDRCLSRAACPPCILTKPPPVRSGCDYGNGKEDPVGAERIQGFESTFSITDSGLHRPKIVICIGSQGGRYRQLVKGEDEIRQDAVMEQVFTYVNELMRRRQDDQQHKRDSMNASRELRMVTYNIIPLSPASGVLEWVENSITLGDAILDKSAKGQLARLGTHSRYYPGEWGYSRCRQHANNSPSDERRETFDVVCKCSSPSFRFFFVERWGHSLKDWYGAKQKFTRSVAVSSIVGHILGIGDRHTNNILVSQMTGEVVHIDFGIVFEQGKLLNVPEVVPFRLTRNVVDGMGPTGTEGTFARSAEATAVVLRENANALLTILSAIASDPLYRWSVSPVEARRRQRLADDDQQQPTPSKERNKGGPNMSHTESKSDRNEAAALVLAKIGEKLQGYEDGTSGEQQSVEGQVQLLINSARDPDNLCVMFAGWAPWI